MTPEFCKGKYEPELRVLTAPSRQLSPQNHWSEGWEDDYSRHKYIQMQETAQMIRDLITADAHFLGLSRDVCPLNHEVERHNQAFLSIEKPISFFFSVSVILLWPFPSTVEERQGILRREHPTTLSRRPPALASFESMLAPPLPIAASAPRCGLGDRVQGAQWLMPKFRQTASFGIPQDAQSEANPTVFRQLQRTQSAMRLS